MQYKISQYAKKNNVTIRTVWNWIRLGKLNTIKTKTNRTIIIEDEDKNKNDFVGVYARVSSSENKTNLENQKNRLIDYCSARGYKIVSVVTEIGSGLNDKRPKLEKLLLDYGIKKIVVEHSDRFSRFGFNYIEKLLKLQDREIEVINQPMNEKEDLMNDFVSIITSFTARLYGLRRNKRRTEMIIKELSEQEINKEKV